MAISVRNLDASLGAEVGGIDLSKPLARHDIATIEDAWRERLVVVFHGQDLSDPQLIAFSRYFGELDPPGPNPYGEPFLKQHPELNVISNVVEIQIDEDGLLVRRDMEDGYQTVRAFMPAVLLSSTGLDQPRLPSLKGIMAAKKKSVDTHSARVVEERRLTWDAPQVPAKTVSGTIVQDVSAAEAAKQLVDWLQEQKLI